MGDVLACQWQEKKECGCGIADLVWLPRFRILREKCFRGCAAEIAGGHFTMNAAARRSTISSDAGSHQELVRGERRRNLPAGEELLRIRANGRAEHRARVYIAAENRLLREALS